MVEWLILKQNIFSIYILIDQYIKHNILLDDSSGESQIVSFQRLFGVNAINAGLMELIVSTEWVYGMYHL